MPATLRLPAMMFAALAASVLCSAQASAEFHRTLVVSGAEPVVLAVEVPAGDVDILYNREGQVLITAMAQGAGDSKLDDKYFSTTLSLEQSGNRVSLRQIPDQSYSREKIKIRFRIDVPFRTEVVSAVKEGKQTIRGLLGPVEAREERGDLNVSYVSQRVHAEVGRGNLRLQVIGEHIDASVLSGNISGERLPLGISAETQDGDITLAIVGPSTVTVKKGSGRVEVAGARGPLTATTDAGDLHVQAVPHADWKLNSVSGTVRLDLPPAGNFELDASTGSGELQIERDDLSQAAIGLRHTNQRANGGGKRIQVQTETGKIVVR